MRRRKICRNPSGGLFFILVALLSVAHTALSTERTWVGASGASWYDASSWDPSGIPKATDTAIFRPEGETLVIISGGMSVCRIGELRFESGKTIFGRGTDDTVALYFGNTVTNILYVAEDAEAVLSNRFQTVSSKYLRRTGKGKLTILPFCNDCWNYNSSYNLQRCDFVEGETILGSASGNYPLAGIPVHISSNAVVKCVGNYRLRTTQDIDVDKGGLLNCGGYTQYMRSLTGEGVVTNFASIYLYLTTGACTFKGQFFHKAPDGHSVLFNARPSGMSDEDWGFVIGASNTLANTRITQPAGEGDTLRFAPGIGEFWIGELLGSDAQYFPLEDTNGIPITVRAKFYSSTVPRIKGNGNFLATASVTISQPKVIENMTGLLGACNGATLSIGNDTAASWPGISSLGGFMIEDGKIAIKNKNAEDAVVGGTVKFLRSTSRLSATAALVFDAGSAIQFNIPPTGLGADITPISAPNITFDATTAITADVAAYRETIGHKTRITLATASSTLTLPDEVLEAANANASTTGCRFMKSGNSLVMDVSRPGGMIFLLK